MADLQSMKLFGHQKITASFVTLNQNPQHSLNQGKLRLPFKINEIKIISGKSANDGRDLGI